LLTDASRPEVVATPDPINNKVYTHNAFFTDGILPYIDWAVANGYGVLDVNVPQHVSNPTVCPPPPF
jgi:histone deacetylase 6